MNAFDFSVFYVAGMMLLNGQNPYMNPLYFYPFPFTYFCALLALPGYDAMPVMFVLWGVLNVALLIHAFGKNFWKWIFFFPFFHLLSSGQVEMIFWSLERHMKPGWRGAILGAFITLKPQTAIILLPWHLVDWLRHDRVTLAKWIGCTALLWGLPLLWRPDWLSTWLVARSSGDGSLIYSASVSNGVFTVLRLTGADTDKGTGATGSPIVYCPRHHRSDCSSSWTNSAVQRDWQSLCHARQPFRLTLYADDAHGYGPSMAARSPQLDYDLAGLCTWQLRAGDGAAHCRHLVELAKTSSQTTTHRYARASQRLTVISTMIISLNPHPPAVYSGSILRT